MDKEMVMVKEQKVQELHADSLKWISKLRFIRDELSFIEKLLNSYVFEPTTPNLFERLQDYLRRLEKTNSALNTLEEAIQAHELELGGLMECETLPVELEVDKEHLELSSKALVFEGDYANLKAEIFNYAGGILKRRKE